MQINLRQIEAFRAFMVTGSVTKAAEIMHVTQPAVSRLLADFEHVVDFKLFDRDRRRLAPTKACEALFREVERTFAGLDNISRAATAIRNMQTGHLSIVAMPILTMRFLPEVIARFSAQFPGVAISLWSWPREQALGWVTSQQYELGFLTLPVSDDAVEIEPFPPDEAVCILPPDHPLAGREVIGPPDLADEDFISLTPGVHFRHLVNEVFRACGVQMRVKIEVTSAATVCDLVARGLGVSVIGSLATSEHEKLAVAVRPFRPTIPFHVGIVYPRQRSLSRLARSFADVAHTCYRPMG